MDGLRDQGTNKQTGGESVLQSLVRQKIIKELERTLGGKACSSRSKSK